MKFHKLLGLFTLSIPLLLLSQNSLRAQVEERWSAHFTGNYNNSDDCGKDAVVDNLGNVYVTGYVQNIYSYYDYQTIKYDSTGHQEWEASYNGIGNSTDMACRMAIDINNNVYVTGSSRGANWSNDAVTIKYNSAGIEQWVARFDGQSNGFDEGYNITVDDFCDVYVTGITEISSQDYNYDYFTVKYDSLGAQRWASFYNGPANSYDAGLALAIGSDGAVYVTGRSWAGDPPQDDMLTIKYDSLGNELYSARHNNPENNTDIPCGIGLDEQSNVYVGGKSFQVPYPNFSLDFKMISYDSTLSQRWVTSYDGYLDTNTNSEDIPYDMIVEPDGDSYLTGHSYQYHSDQTQDVDYATVKFNSGGGIEWVATFDGPRNYDQDFARSVALDEEGHIYVTGDSPDPSGLTDFVTVKFDQQGVTEWTARFAGPNNTSDKAYVVVVDTFGHVFATGTGSLPGRGYDFTTVMYGRGASGVDNDIIMPDDIFLSQNYPNPFNAQTKIQYTLQAQSMVTISIFDLLGRRIETIAEGIIPAGDHQAIWDAIGQSSGIYFYRIKAGDMIETKKMVLMK